MLGTSIHECLPSCQKKCTSKQNVHSQMILCSSSINICQERKQGRLHSHACLRAKHHRDVPRHGLCCASEHGWAFCLPESPLPKISLMLTRPISVELCVHVHLHLSGIFLNDQDYAKEQPSLAFTHRLEEVRGDGKSKFSVLQQCHLQGTSNFRKIYPIETPKCFQS